MTKEKDRLVRLCAAWHHAEAMLVKISIKQKHLEKRYKQLFDAYYDEKEKLQDAEKVNGK